MSKKRVQHVDWTSKTQASMTMNSATGIMRICIEWLLDIYTPVHPSRVDGREKYSRRKNSVNELERVFQTELTEGR